MWMGHYAPALLVKAFDPSVPLWMPVLGAQFMDVLWGCFSLAGIEKFELPDPPLSGFPADLVYIPWSHSLPMATLWSLVFAVAGLVFVGVTKKQSSLLALSVFSHWVCDYAVHHPDLPLTLDGNGVRLGCGMWDKPVAEATFEMYLLGAAAIIWTGSHLKRRSTRGVWPVLSFFTLLGIVQFNSHWQPAPTNATILIVSALVTYVTCTLAAVFIDR